MLPSEKTPDTLANSPVSPPTLEQVATDMMTLNWPDYNRDPYAYTTLGGEKRMNLRRLVPSIDTVDPSTQINGFFLPFANKEEAIDANDMPESVRLEVLKSEVNDCKLLAQLLDEGPFGACNKKVSAAIRAGISEAADALLAAYTLQRPDAESRYIRGACRPVYKTTPTYACRYSRQIRRNRLPRRNGRV